MKIVWIHQIARFQAFTFDSIGDKFRFTNLRSYHSKSEFYDVFKQDKHPRLNKVLSVHYNSQDRPKVTKGLM